LRALRNERRREDAMRQGPAGGTRWFSLSDRELLVLVAGVGVALLAVGATRLFGVIWPRGEITVSEGLEVVPLPARLNVNTAQDYELAMLPGIGPKTAKAIVDYRSANGPFASLDDLTKVSGIGPKTVEAIQPYAMCAPAAGRKLGGD
jgi:competence ComEA-like helix-hairpin-helix protein